MMITKFGHCCMLIEQQGVRLLTDPGMFSTAQNEVTNIDVILITHDHPDHLHMESLKLVLAKNPAARVITNNGVGETLAREGVPFEIVEDTQATDIKGVSIEGIGKLHALMHATLPQIPNTGYMIAGRIFYPGDALTIPERKVDILALPVAGPWMKLSDGIDYALAVRPRMCFPVHEGILVMPGTAHRIPPQILEPAGIKFQVLEIGVPTEL